MNHLTISDYKEWTPGLYLIDAGCSAGKSTFVIKELYPFAKEQGRRILLLSNRLALKKQQEILAQDTDIELMTYQKVEFNQYQQKIEVLSNYQHDDLLNRIEEFDYLVLDEAHYLFQDASFNPRTEDIIKIVKHYKDSKIILMMSATSQLLKEYYGNWIKKTYYVERDYSYIKGLYAYTTRETVSKIIQSIPLDEKILFFSDKKKRLTQLHNLYKDSVYLESGNKDVNPVFQQIITQERFNERILLTTKVLDNGINLKDDKIKHIFIEMTDMVEFVQCLGRKRVLDSNDTVTVYFYAGIDTFSGSYGRLKRNMKIAAEYFPLKENGGFEIFQDKYRFESNMPKFFDNKMEIIYPAYFKAEHDYAFYKKITTKETSFVKEVCKELKRPCRWYEKMTPDDELESYLESNLGRKYFKADKEELAKIFDIRKDGHLLKSVKIMNQYLENNGFKYCIDIGTEKRRRYWVIKVIA